MNEETWKIDTIVNISQGPWNVGGDAGDGDDWTWLADELKTLTVLVPDENVRIMELRHLHVKLVKIKHDF